MDFPIEFVFYVFTITTFYYKKNQRGFYKV